MHRDGKRDPTPGAVDHWIELVASKGKADGL